MTWGTRSPESEPREGELKETRFEWVDPLPERLRTGIVNYDPEVKFKRVGNFVWPKSVPNYLENSKTISQSKFGLALTTRFKI